MLIIHSIVPSCLEAGASATEVKDHATCSRHLHENRWAYKMLS